MRVPRGLASSMLSLTAGIAAATAVALTWMPVIRYTELRESELLARQLAMTATLTAKQLSMRPESERQDALEEVLLLGSIDQIMLLSTDAPPVSAGHGPTHSQVQPLCPPERFQNSALITVPPTDFGDGKRIAGACAPLLGPEGDVTGVTAVFSGLRYEQQLAQQQWKARNLLLLLGSLSGIVVMFVIQLLLAPIQAISRTAALIADGNHKVRVKVRGPDEIAQLARTVNDLARYLERREDEIGARMAVVKQLASMVAHEVRNPLQSLSLLCTLARTEDNAEKRDRLLASIHDEINILEGVVQRFLRSSGPLRIRREAHDLVLLLKQVTDMVQPRAQKNTVSMLVQAPGSCHLFIDGSLVRRALENLILNAVEFAGQEPPGQVTVSLLPRRGQVVLLVEDDGPGVPPHEQERIFEQYYSSKPGGTGLGLTLVRRVFETHGGSVRCESSTLGGARFTATIPTTDANQSTNGTEADTL